MTAAETTIGVSRETKELVRRQLRGGETYDELVARMARQYDPENPEVADEPEPA